MSKVSVIIPNYNKSQYVEECINSIIDNVSCLTVEIIVVDDCSTDKSVDIIKNLDVVLIENECNVGPAESRNKGIENSNGEYIICLDSDDKIPINYIQENYNNIIQTNSYVSYTDSHCFGLDDKLLCWPKFDIEKLRTVPFINCAAMYRREVWLKNNYDSNLSMWEDYDFWLSAAKEGFTFKKCESTVLYYRQLSDSRDSDKSKLLEVVSYLKNKHGDFYIGKNYD